jgi:putative acyl-CoA dehydrogenase
MYSPTEPHSVMADTHEVTNVSRELAAYNMYTEDAALKEAVERERAGWANADLTRFGALTGSAEYLELGAVANKYIPELETHDRFGNRVDLIKFHPAYHTLMRTTAVRMSVW